MDPFCVTEELLKSILMEIASNVSHYKAVIYFKIYFKSHQHI